MTCHYYPPADLDELEEEATQADVSSQVAALQIVAGIFNRAGLPYGVMGGMNFYFRGTGRTTDDVDLAVTGEQSLEKTLELLEGEERITRPRSRMAWVGGVARTFVRVDKQQVQIDLKWQKSEGHGMPLDLDSATEVFHLTKDKSAPGVRFLRVAPLVKAKFQSYGREKPGDYVDLLFICTHPKYGAEVEGVAGEIRLEKRELFLREVGERHGGRVKEVGEVLGVDLNVLEEVAEADSDDDAEED
ncbi:uncharacterized protein C8A04DRAFT_32579 [Dichotomopilus funicola]|uniref:Uncharacterized protein n=1 Tax=Dichotomopilus funicola TaxID=1934379 RepID=A0AAN6ZJR2_9PEZI|nr:hypothetical protein C8A04DRAFT_32579 [Dichotomopilus funicola]